MLVGAFAAVVGSYYLRQRARRHPVAVVVTVVFSLILAYGATVFRGDPVVICIGMNLLASGLTAYLLRQMFGVSGTFSDPAIVGLDKIRIAAIQAMPVIGWVFSPPDRPHLARLAPGRRRHRRSLPHAARPSPARRRRGCRCRRDHGRRRHALPHRHRARRRRPDRACRRAALARHGQHLLRGHERRPRLDRRRRRHARPQPSALCGARLRALRLRRRALASACRARACPTSSPTSCPMS